jgi:hypothetical protein
MRLKNAGYSCKFCKCLKIKLKHIDCPLWGTFLKKLQETYNFGIILTTGLAQKLGSEEVEDIGW